MLTAREDQQAQRLFNADVPALLFPRKCSRLQFIDYYVTIFLGFQQASTPVQVHTTVDAARAWTAHFHFDNHGIKESKRRRTDRRDPGNNRNQAPADAQDELARRALRAARR